MKKVRLYSGYERFWHWAQALLIFFLLLTGFEVHNSFSFFGYEVSVNAHNIAGWLLVFLFVTIPIWMLTTGQWKQYVPTLSVIKGIPLYIKYYGLDIFLCRPHPTHKTLDCKFNPLQRLTYLGVMAFLVPLQVVTGIMYLYPHFFGEGVQWIAVLHTIGAFAVIVFIIVHVYLCSTGHTIVSNIVSMITGWEELEDEEDAAHGNHG